MNEGGVLSAIELRDRLTALAFPETDHSALRAEIITSHDALAAQLEDKTSRLEAAEREIEHT